MKLINFNLDYQQNEIEKLKKEIEELKISNKN